MEWKEIHPVDLVECLEISPARMGVEQLGREGALRSWRKLLDCESFHSSVVAASPSRGRGKIVAFGASVFVSRDFANAEITYPRPGLNGRILASLDSKAPVVLNARQLRADNTAGALQLVILYGSWMRDALSANQISEAQMLLARSFQQLHDGFHVERMISELVDAEDMNYAQAIRAWHIVDRFAAFYANHPEARWNRDRALAVVTRETVDRDPGSVASCLFHHRRPVLGLSAGEQSMVRLALRGMTDHEVAAQLSVGVAAIKRRWSTLFDRASKSHPSLVPAKEGEGRGPQKRYRVLSYISEHPEELRPFHLSPTATNESRKQRHANLARRHG